MEVMILRLPFLLLLAGPATAADNLAGPLLERPSKAATEDEAPSPAIPAAGWTGFLRELSEEVIPHEYEVREGWGDKEEVFAGFNLRRGDVVPRISKRTKQVNHGVWRRFRVRLLHPEERLRFEIRNNRVAAARGLSCEVLMSARLRCTANAEFWNRGIKTGSATVQSDMTLQGVAEFHITARQEDPDGDDFFTDVIFVPEAGDLRLRLADLDVRRIGKLEGDAAKALGDASTDIVEHFLREQEPRVRKRIQRALEAAEAELRVPLPRAWLQQSAAHER